jgi:peptidoglycan/LPS O-acetylase OafA/YrhL
MTSEHDIALKARPSATGKERIIALDGLRAISLIIIMGFHFGVGWLSGGFFGLDIFYVLSGYLITGLLVGEYRKRDGIILSAFWLRRARRLLPALLIVLVAVTLLVRFDAAAGLYPNFRMSALSALFYFSNWWQIAASGNYFAVTGAVSPLTHTWSLAVEEQFYLIWPLVVLAVMGLSRTISRGLHILLCISVVGALGSALEMALLYSPSANVTRLYFGTDTHAQSLLVGSTMACVMTLIQMRRGNEGMAPVARSAVTRRLLVAVGLAGLAGTLTLTYTLVGTSAIDYRGGFMLSALSAAAIIIGAVCVPHGAVDRGLSWRPLVWLGTISYGAYLWHFPVFVFLNYGQTGLSPSWLLAFRCAATIALATVSYYVVERPIMYGTFWRSVKALAPACALMLATVSVIIAGTVVPATARVVVDRFHKAPSGAKPRQLIVLGDSTALTLGYALAATAPAGTTVTNGGLFGCGFIIGTNASNDPPTPQLPMFPACNTATPLGDQWPALDAIKVADTAPGDIVMFVAGVWEVQDILRNGRWTNISQSSDQRYLLAEMRKAVQIGTAHGAHFDFTTMPPLATGASDNEPPLPQDSKARRLIYDRLVRKTAEAFPGRVSIIDYGAILAPGGVYAQYRDGVEIRTADGIHTPSYSPGDVFAGNSTQAVAHAFYDWLSPRIWPLLIASNPVAPAAHAAPPTPSSHSTTKSS